LGYTWGKKGKKIEINNYGRHGRMNMIGAFELGTGLFYGVLTSFKVNAMRFRRFICHLKHEMRTDKILLICDNASFHKAKWLTEWAKTQYSWLQLELLPAYSPDFNPIERFWRWLKTDFTHNRCWKTKQELKKYLVGLILSLLLDHCLLLHPEQNTRLKSKRPAGTVGRLREIIQVEAWLAFVRDLLSVEDPRSILEQLSQALEEALEDIFQMTPSSMNNRELGRLEPTPSLKHHAQRAQKEA